jgi:ribonuclease HI
VNCIKCNIDGASNGNPGNSACGGIFRGQNSKAILCFSKPLGICTAYHAELCAFVRAIEVISQNQWNNIRIEADSSLVAFVYKSHNQIPWSLRNRWNNAKAILQELNCMITHIFREGNQVIDSLANHGLSLDSLVFWNDVP